MSKLNWGMVQDGGTFESLMHAILFAEDPRIILFGRPGKDAGQDARTEDGVVVFQAKYRQDLTMDAVVSLANEELDKIKKYRLPEHGNHPHWQNAKKWVLVANFEINPNDYTKWKTEVIPAFQEEGLEAVFWDIAQLEGKLTDYPHVLDVFFGGENRVLVGLKEAHDLLGGCSLEHPIIGREEELDAIRAFSESEDKRVLPVIGPGGIGKTRLIYESLTRLSESGWRVFWALPGTMARSSRWFHLLNGSQRTCVALDDPDDPGLLGAVMEQLAPIERKNWKVIIACRSIEAEMLRRNRGNRQLEIPLALRPLNEDQSKELLKKNLSHPQKDTFLFAMGNLAGHVPGWLCLATEMINSRRWDQLPSKVDEVADGYVNASIRGLQEADRAPALILLRWLALWGEINIEANANNQVEKRFLVGLGIPEPSIRELLGHLRDVGLVRNWGVGKRLFAVSPLIVREHLLSNWLLQEVEGVFHVNEEGSRLVKDLVSGQLPGVERALGSLTHLSLSRLDEGDGLYFFKPFFDEMVLLARNGTLLDQYRILGLVEKSGAADPESALEVLIEIRSSHKDDQEVDGTLWGPQTITRTTLVIKIPWVLFQIAEQVSDRNVARRYIDEFQEFISLELEGEPWSFISGQRPMELLERLLRQPSSWSVFAEPARELTENTIQNESGYSPITEVLLRTLLNPEQEGTEQTSNWTITFSRKALIPGCEGWEMILGLRTKLFEVLKTNAGSPLRTLFWQVLEESHHQFHRMVMHHHVRGDAALHYRNILTSDLTTCADILLSPSEPLAMEEATYARAMWSWYLDHGSDDDPLELARKCEHIYNELSAWRIQDFFRFAREEALAPETNRVVAKLKESSDEAPFLEFFSETKRYLDVVRGQQGDGADWGRISTLAEALIDQFSLPVDNANNPLPSFVMRVLGQAEDENRYAWDFAISICQKHIRRTKDQLDDNAGGHELDQLLSLSHNKARFLFAMYSHSHPASIGILTGIELDYVLEQEADFSDQEWFVLLGSFAMVRWETIQSLLINRLKDMRGDPGTSSKLIATFIRFLEISSLRYEWPKENIPTGWIIEIIMDFDLDGALLGMHELEWLRDNSDFKLTMPQFVALVRSRIELENKPKPKSKLEILPYNFKVTEWCLFNETNLEDASSFGDFCRLLLDYGGFVSIYRLPKYVAKLNPSGICVKSFVKQYLEENPGLEAKQLARLAYLASAYPNTSEAWSAIALPICQKAQRLRREDREHTYFCLSRKETGVLSSRPGEVPDFYFQECEDAARMLKEERNDSPLVAYRKWALRGAQHDLQREQGRAEEDVDG